MLVILGYIWFQVSSFAAAPPLEIVTPGAEVRVTVEQVEVAGLTDPMAQLMINDQPVTVDTEGRFRQPVALVAGVNTIEISVKNKAEKETVKTIQLLADIPEQQIDLTAIPTLPEAAAGQAEPATEDAKVDSE
jgi:hypothetical protein